VCLASAYAHELTRFGITLGLTNYAAAYATGLLLARRVNSKYGLAEMYEGNKEIDGADYNVEANDERAPFKALLDVGLTRTTTGARIFGALKGACDGGLDVPHKDRRFPGSKREDKEWVADPEVHRKYIFGGHVAAWMSKLQEENEEAYNRQFKRFVDAGIGADDLEALYTEAHKKIRANPNEKRPALAKGYFHTREAPAGKPEKKRWRRAAISLQQRKARIRVKLTAKGVRSIKAEIAAGVAQPRDLGTGGAAVPAEGADVEGAAEEEEAETGEGDE